MKCRTKKWEFRRVKPVTSLHNFNKAKLREVTSVFHDNYYNLEHLDTNHKHRNNDIMLIIFTVLKAFITTSKESEALTPANFVMKNKETIGNTIKPGEDFRTHWSLLFSNLMREHEKHLVCVALNDLYII